MSDNRSVSESFDGSTHTKRRRQDCDPGQCPNNDELKEITSFIEEKVKAFQICRSEQGAREKEKDSQIADMTRIIDKNKETIERLENEIRCKTITTEQDKSYIEKLRSEYKHLEEAHKKLETDNEMLEKKHNSAINSKLEAVVQHIKKITQMDQTIEELKKQLKTKTLEMVRDMDEKNKTIEELKKEVQTKAIKAEVLEKTNKILKTDDDSLKKKVKYFQVQNGHISRKSIGVSQNLIKNQKTNREFARMLNQSALDMNAQNIEDIIKYIQKVKERSDRIFLQKTSKGVEYVRQKK